MTLKENISHIDHCIRKGLFHKATRSINKLLSEDPNVAFSSKVKIAGFYRRLGRPLAGFKLLKKDIDSETHQDSAEGLLEYGYCLIEAGDISQGRKALQSITKEKSDVFLLSQKILGYSFFPTWDFEKSLTFLAPLARDTDFDDYPNIVFYLNYCLALIQTRSFLDAERLVKKIRRATKSNHPHLYFNSLELNLQLLYLSDQLKEAEKLSASIEIPQSMGGLSLLFMNKWKFLSQKHKSKKEFNKICQQAIQLRSWEGLRDLSFEFAKSENNRSLLNKVYWGTPYLSYRKKFNRLDIDRKRHITTKKSSIIDLSRFALNSTSILNEEKVCRLLAALGNDFFSPKSLCEMHNYICPDEIFDPFSSPAKIRQLLKRTRRHFESTSCSSSIDYDGFGYSLNLQDCQLVVSHQTERIFQSSAAFLLNQLRKKTFCSEDIVQLYSVPERTARHWLKQELEAGRISLEKTEGRKKLYRLTAKNIT